MKYLYLFLAVGFNAAAYMIFKSISTKQNGILWFGLFSIGLILGAINVFLFTKALKHLSLAIAYPIFSGASIALITLASYLIFGERISLTNIFGAGVIIVGIFFITQ